ncbi:MAG: indolepyruvate oxidoreductase subunit beta [Oscillospiraceae bacterium]
MNDTKSILLVGVGGQGTILAAKLLTNGLMQAGYDVKMSEIHGMSQRGGSVSSQVRYGTRVLSPVIEQGGADVLVAFEKMEALRWLDYLRVSGSIIVNNYEIPSMPILSGSMAYPAGILEELSSKARVTIIDAAAESQKLGSQKFMNVLLLGATIRRMGLRDIDWATILRENVKPQFVEMNLRALEAGAALCD